MAEELRLPYTGRRSKEVVNRNVVRAMQQGLSEADIRSYISEEGYDPDNDITFWKQPSRLPEFKAKMFEPSFEEGFKSGIQNIRGDVLQLLGKARAALGTTPKEEVDKFTAEEEARRQRYAQSPTGQSLLGNFGQAMGEAVLPGAAIPAPSAKMGAGLKAAYNTGVGLGLGAMNFVPEGGSRLENTAVGGLAGLILPPAVGAVTGLGIKATNAMLGRIPGIKQELMESSAKHGVRLQYPDISPESGAARRTGTFLERLPLIGTGKERMLQAGEAQTAAGKFRETLGTTGEDWGKQTAIELGTKFDRLKTTQKVLYQAAERAAGEGNLQIRNTISTIDGLIAEQKNKIDPDPELINRLTKWRENLATKGTSFKALTSFQDDIQASIRESEQPGSLIKANSNRPLIGLKQALDSDIKTSIPAKARKAWEQADDFTNKRLEPFRDEVRKILGERDPDAQYKLIMANVRGKPSTVYASLTPAGQESVRYGMVTEALEVAKNPNGTFSPAKFAKFFEDNDPMASVFFKEHKTELDGFRKLMRATERGGQYAENPPTGQRLIAGAGLYGGIGAATGLAAMFTSHPILATAAGAAGVGIPYITKILFTTKGGQRFLAASSKLTADDPKAFNQLLNAYAPRIAIEYAAQTRLRSQYGSDSQTESPTQ